MSHDFLSRFRRQLFEWLQLRVASGRLPFRRVEELTPVLTGSGVLTPDLVLWINRDSLLAGAMLLVPPKSDATTLEKGCEAAACLGLRRFATWEAHAVNLWETEPAGARLAKRWPMPESHSISADDFAIAFEQLLQELKNLAVSSVLPAEQLPPAYFANLCLQTLTDTEAARQEAARLAARPGQTDRQIAGNARDQGWLTLWRLLTLLQHDRMPPGVRPERLDRAMNYALAELDGRISPHLAPSSDEPSLPESAAIRFHHLAGRLSQLGWGHPPERAAAAIRLLFTVAAEAYHVTTTALPDRATGKTLLVNHLPPQPVAGDTHVAPRPCLAGWPAAAPLTGHVAQDGTFDSVANLPAEARPAKIVAHLVNTQPPPAADRRRRLAALRQPWPYRRFQLAGDAPTWLWDALHLGGLADPDGTLQMTLPANWATAAEAEQLWARLAERLTLTALRQLADGRQTLTLTGHGQFTDNLEINLADGTSCQLPPLPDDAGPTCVAKLIANAQPVAVTPRRGRKPPAALADRIAAEVFRDGLPLFPEDYLRRIDLPPLRSYQLPGPLRIDTCFFDRVRLTGPDGAIVESAHPVDAEALVLASRDGRSRVDLPTDAALTMRLMASYRADLRRLWQTLLDACRRHHPAQRKALALARQLWRERNLPAVEDL